MSDLRSLWPTLSSRERDAKVAEVLGWTVVETSTEAHRQLNCIDPLGRPSTSLHFVGGDPHFEATTMGANYLPFYSSSWGDSGPLLDKLREEGWTQIKDLADRTGHPASIRLVTTLGSEGRECELTWRRMYCCGESDGAPRWAGSSRARLEEEVVRAALSFEDEVDGQERHETPSPVCFPGVADA